MYIPIHLQVSQVQGVNSLWDYLDGEDSKLRLRPRGGIMLSKLDWRGSTSTWLLNFAEQLRLYNDMVPNQADQFSDGMMIAFLKSAVSGVPGLSSVHATWTAAQKGAGIRNSVLTFPAYLQLLLAQASILDAPKGTRSTRYKANVTEHIFDDEDDDDVIEPDDDGLYEIDNHEINVDTSVEYMIALTERSNKNSGFPKRRAWMDNDTWSS